MLVYLLKSAPKSQKNENCSMAHLKVETDKFLIVFNFFYLSASSFPKSDFYFLAFLGRVAKKDWPF